MWTIRYGRAKGRLVPSAGNGSLPCRPPPEPRQWRLVIGTGPEGDLLLRMPALSTTRPLASSSPLTNELLSSLSDYIR